MPAVFWSMAEKYKITFLFFVLAALLAPEMALGDLDPKQSKITATSTLQTKDRADQQTSTNMPGITKLKQYALNGALGLSLLNDQSEKSSLQLLAGATYNEKGIEPRVELQVRW